MRTSFFSLLIGLCLSLPSVGFISVNGPQFFGKKIDDKGAIPATELPKLLSAKNKIEGVKITGKVSSVCQQKGCWLTMDLGNGQQMRVKFKDYAFFLPKDCAGKQAVLQGIATKETVSIDEQKHYLKDAGKSEAEIAKITQAQETISFEAEGVMLTQSK